MKISIVGIGINISLFVIIILVLVFALIYQKQLDECKNNQSPFCPKISCPNSSGGLCNGYAQRKDNKGNIYCSFAPNLPNSST
ncbi:MAG: hypothetical protein QXG00_05935 [Candidatus Woesearchaeota archaeon]